MKSKRNIGIKGLLIFVLILCLGMTSFCFFGCGGEKEVKSISVSKNPTKTEYLVGEEFSAAGGEITVTYADGTTEIKSMTDEGVEIGELNITVDEGDTVSKKTVKIRYGGKGAKFEITVRYEKFAVTFDYGYKEKDNVTSQMNKGDTVERPEDPTRENYTFDNWYADPALTVAYDFKNGKIDGDTTIYAKWLDNNATYFDVQFDYNFIGAVNPAPQKVKSGEKAVKLTVDPQREGYKFDCWMTEAGGGTEFDFGAAVTAAVTVYAKWTRTSTGKQTFVFEAEDTNLEGKTGIGLSGTAPGKAMVQKAPGLEASNERCIGYLYESGLSLEFQIVSDMEIEDATIVFRLSAEIRDFDIDPSTVNISVNYDYIQYEKISFTNVPKGGSDDVTELKALPFKDYTIATDVKLVEGRNFIQLQINNDEATSGTTMTAIGPLVDCLKITTEAILSWDASLGLPKKNY